MQLLANPEIKLITIQHLYSNQIGLGFFAINCIDIIADLFYSGKNLSLFAMKMTKHHLHHQHLYSIQGGLELLHQMFDTDNKPLQEALKL